MFIDTLEVYTVEEVVDRLGFGLFQLGVTMFAGAFWVQHVAYVINIHLLYILFGEEVQCIVKQIRLMF